MIQEREISQGRAATYRLEQYNMAIDRVKEAISATGVSPRSITVPTIPLIDLARVLINGEGAFTISNRY